MVWLPTAAAVVLATLLIAQHFGVFQSAAPSTPPAAISRFVETVTGGLQLAPAPSLALTQDGRRLAYVAVQDGARALYVRDLDDVTARPLAGTQDADQPFFSPDGRWIAFFAESKLKKVAVAGGAPITIAPVANPRGGTWLPDNTIIFAPSAASVLMRVSAEGGKAEPASTLDRSAERGEPPMAARAAGRRRDRVRRRSDRLDARVDGSTRRRAVVWPAQPPPRRSRRTARSPTSCRADICCTSQSGLVYAHAFDPKTFQTTGDAFPILERITQGRASTGDR